MSKSAIAKVISGRASYLVCLFLFAAPQLSPGQDLVFQPPVREAYQQTMNLRCREALALLSDENDVASSYVASLSEAIELLITEDNSKFSEYEERFQKRIDKNLKASPRDYQFLQAEIRLHWAFVYLKFGHELDAALHLRQAYQIASACKEKYPDYLPIRKTTGILEVIVGSVPDKYNWILSLLSMDGSVSEGLADLQKVGASGGPLALEGKLLFALVQGFILSKPGDALSNMKMILREEKANKLALFFATSLALKDSQNEVALQMLQDLSRNAAGIPLYYADYLKGEAHLHKGEYLNAIQSYRWFISHQNGQNYIKDAWYKIGLCYWLHGNENDAHAVFKEARGKGKEATEADKAAARSLADPQLPNVKLSRVRYLTDGGYYHEAGKLLASITSMDLPEVRDQAEYYYRKARLAHKTGKDEAVDSYLETIRMTGQENWYFAPNACLQLGYLYQSRNMLAEAEEYFLRALAYKRHEYKNSIDSKARSALAQLGRI